MQTDHDDVECVTQFAVMACAREGLLRPIELVEASDTPSERAPRIGDISFVEDKDGRYVSLNIQTPSNLHTIRSTQVPPAHLALAEPRRVGTGIAK